MTIMEMERGMLKERHLPNDYWVESVDCTTHITN